MTTVHLKGTFAAIITPLDGQGNPDASAFCSLAEYLLEYGCDGLNVLGTTGEATSFSIGQRLKLMRVAARRLPVERMMVGTGVAAVADAVKLSKTATELGFGGALVLPPFYYKKVPNEGIVRYFEEIVSATRDTQIPIYLYNFPALSGVAYTHDLISLLISEFGSRIAGLKDSSGDLDYARKEAARPNFDVFPSDEATLLEAREGVFTGCISATVNVTSSFCSAAFHQGDREALQNASDIRALLTKLQLVPAVKALLSHIHTNPDLARTKPPFISIPDSEIHNLLSDYRGLITAN